MLNSAQKTACLLGIIVGIIIIGIGFSLKSYPSSYIDEQNIGKSIQFGADFYTEMYAVTQDVGEATNNVVHATNRVANAIRHLCELVGWLIISLGAFDVCFFLYKFCSIISWNNSTEANQKCEAEDKLSREIEERTLQQNANDPERVLKWKEGLNDQGGGKIGKCDVCGARRKQLVFSEFEDVWGKAKRNMCYHCFCRHNASPARRDK